MQDLIITLVQCDLKWEDREANLQAFDRRLASLKGNTDLVILPEMFSTGFSMNGEQCAEEADGPAVMWLRDKAAALNSVITGSIMIKEQGCLFNRLYWMRPDGTFETYDKRHLFRFGNEHEHFSAGNKFLVSELKGWKFMPLVCYDLRFPVWSRNKYKEGQFAYDCLVYIANWPEKRNHHWKALLAGRAIENLSYCIGVNRTGTDGRNIKYSGDSCIADPTGMVTTICAPGEECIITTVLSAATLLKWRECFNTGQDWDEFLLK